jgi:hypothetical protein
MLDIIHINIKLFELEVDEEEEEEQRKERLAVLSVKTFALSNEMLYCFEKLTIFL